MGALGCGCRSRRHALPRARNRLRRPLEAEQLLAVAGFGKGDAEAGKAALARLEAIEAEERAGRARSGDEAEAKARDEGKSAADISKAMADAMQPYTDRVETLQGPLAELRLHAAIASGDGEAARASLEAMSDKQRGGIDKTRLAQIYLALGNNEKALELAKAHADSGKQQLQPQAAAGQRAVAGGQAG